MRSSGESRRESGLSASVCEEPPLGARVIEEEHLGRGVRVQWEDGGEVVRAVPLVFRSVRGTRKI